MRKNFRKIKAGQVFLNNFNKEVRIVERKGHISIDEDGLEYNDSGNCSSKGRSWNIWHRLPK